MATTTKEYTGDGSKGVAGGELLTFPFQYLKTEDYLSNKTGEYFLFDGSDTA